MDFRRRKPTIAETTALRGLWRQHYRYQGCIGHWLFQSGGGTSVRDVSRMGNDATLVNTDPEDWVYTQQGYGIDFDGSTEHATLASSITLAGTFTCHFWVMIDTFAVAGRFSILGQSGNDRNRLSLTFQGNPVTSCTFMFRPTASDVTIGSGVSTSLINTGTPHLLTWRRNGSNTVEAFLDGRNITSASVTNSDSMDPGEAGTLTPYLGRAGTAQYGDGILIEARIYDRDQTDAEVASMFSDPYAEFTRAQESNPRSWFVPSSSQNVSLTSNITATSSTPDVNAIIARALISNLTAASSTPSVDATMARGLASSVGAASTTPSVDHIVSRALQTDMIAASSTPAIDIYTASQHYEGAGVTSALFYFFSSAPGDDISLTSSIVATSSTPSVNGILARGLQSSISAVSVTPTIDAVIARILSSSIAAVSSTPSVDTVLARSLASSIIAASSTPVVTHIMARSLNTDISISSMTPDIDVMVINVIQLASLIQATSSTPSIDAVINHILASAITANSSTPTVNGILAHGLQSDIIAASSTPSVDMILTGLGDIINARVESLTRKFTVSSL